MKYLALLFSCISLCSAPIDHATISVYAIDTETNKVLIDKESHLSLPAASCTKMITTAAALEIIGPDAHFQTTLEYDGTLDPETGILSGNLWIVGGGDPTLGSSRFNDSWHTQIDAWKSQVQAFGIQKIEGRVLTDISLWEPGQANPSWGWEDLGNYYAAPASALSFAENSYKLTFETKSKKPQILSIDPPLPLESFQNEVTLGAPDSGDQAWIFATEASIKKIVRGSVPKTEAGTFTIKGSIYHPEDLCSSLLEKELTVEKQTLPNSKRTMVHTTTSPSLQEIAKLTNYHSINLYAEHLLKKLGRGSSATGIDVLNKFLKQKGVDLSGLHLADGCGLSTRNVMTTKQLVTFLAAMKNSPAFRETLPQKQKGIIGKSGYHSHIRNYAGYCGDIAFAIFIHNCSDVKAAKAKLDEICNEIALLNSNKE